MDRLLTQAATHTPGQKPIAATGSFVTAWLTYIAMVGTYDTSLNP